MDIELKPTQIQWNNSSEWTCNCGEKYQIPFSSQLRHMCANCGDDVNNRLFASVILSLIDSNFSYDNIPTWGDIGHAFYNQNM